MFNFQVQRLFAKMVSTHPTMVSTQHLRLKGKKLKKCWDCVDTSQKAGRHELQIPGIRLPRSTQNEGRSTLDLVPRIAYFQNWDSRSTPPPGQVDTGSIPRTACLQNGTAGRRKMRAGRHWTSFPEQPVVRFGTVCRHHHQGRSTHYGNIPT